VKKFIAFIRPTLRYWMQTEVHVYCFSVAANVILSLFPFLIVMSSICRYVFHWKAASDAIFVALEDYFPGTIADFIQRNLTVNRLEWVSLLLLLFTANGVFEPLEVALNSIWGIRKNRSFVRNQMVSYGLIFACGTLALISTILTALNEQFVRGITSEAIAGFVTAAVFKMAAIPLAILALFLIYWLLPNGKIPRDRILIAAVVIGLLLEILKYLELLAWPWLFLKLRHEYGPFRISVAIIFFSFFGSMLVLAGAEWAARPTCAAMGTSPDESYTSGMINLR
jgi:membrane protein